MLKYPDSDTALAQALRQCWEAGATTGQLCRSLALARPWRDPPDTLALQATYRFHREAWGTAVAAEVQGHQVDLDAPALLTPVRIPKPWGQEIWFTGIEARGECGVQTPQGVLPLSQYLALAPRRLAGAAPMVLLKILDPRPDPVLGDLYFEVHRDKQEACVVSHVDSKAWPDGAGRIRFGMNAELRAAYADDLTFRQDYLAAVQAYEPVRRAIDAGDRVSPATERQLREDMERFTSLRRLWVGDVVVVPTWLPHALQHGVRVVEFQTPTYERYIISFAQQVLTQDHWDSALAVERMTLEAAPAPDFARIAPGVERIVSFDDFKVWRLTLAPGARFDLPGHPPYLLCMAVQGALRIGSLALAAEQAAFVPGSTLADPARRRALAPVHNPGAEPAIVLLAAPDL